MTAHILVVDDEPDLEPLIRQRFRRPIRDGDWEFVFAHDGVEALAYVNSGAGVDVVLSDINMPNMDGLTLLSHLSNREDIKVVMVSAYADMSNIREAMNRGAFDFITKPMNLADLELTIGKTVDHVMTVRQLRDERDEAKDMARMKGEFIANVSHEIRTPMNAILGLSHLALQQPVQDERSVYLRKIRDAGKHLLSIINDILDMSKVGVGKLELDHLPFDLQHVLTSTVALVEEPVALKKLALVFRIGPGVPRHYRGDGRRLGQVLLNYIGNAAKFTDAGSITLSVEREGELEQERLRFVVTDTGPGLTAEEMARLFQPFEQSDGSVTRRHGGTGLGLSIAKSLSELMGGSVGVESQVGTGSRFWFTAKLAVDVRQPQELLPQGEHGQGLADSAFAIAEAPGAVPDLRGKRILVVEDNLLNIDVACGLLGFAGATIEIARDGAEAVARVSGGCAFDLVLMDIHMPVQDGLAATRQIRQDPKLRGLPIVAMTASAMADESDHCLAAGMNDMIVKPVDPALMFAVLQRWLRLGEAAPPPAGVAPVAASVVTSVAAPVAAPVTAPVAAAGTVAAGAPAGPLVESQRPAEAVAWQAHSLHIEGLDVDAGLRGLLGKEALYLRMLRRFSSTQASAAAEVRQAWRSADIVCASRVAHTVKGLCGTIGATDLAVQASALELALNNHAPEAEIAGHLDRFEAGLVPMCEALKAALPPA